METIHVGLIILALLLPSMLRADDIVVVDDKVRVLEMKEVVKEEFTEQDVDREISDIQFALGDLDAAKERRRKNLEDRFIFLESIKTKFIPKDSEK